MFDSIAELDEDYLGEWMVANPKFKDMPPSTLMQRQRVLQTLYESRIASLQRFVGFAVLFHSMGKAVQDFWPRVSFGLLGYDMSRTQSIMRIATTASPVRRFRTLVIKLSTFPEPSCSKLAITTPSTRSQEWRYARRSWKSRTVKLP